MGFSDATDSELLAGWLDHGREAAFRAVVDRYAGLVFATARRTCGDDLIAEEVSQHTFITLARKAKSLRSCASLGGWLHRTAVLQARNLTRKNGREERKRQKFLHVMKTEPPDSSDDGWKEIQLVLDESLSALSESDREALLLRFYRAMSIPEIAVTLSIGTEAAQKRVTRATERLREKLLRRGVQTGGSLSAVMLAGLTADAQAAVPAVSVIASKAMAAGAANSGGLLFSAASAGVTKSALLVSPLAAALVAGVWIVSQRHSIAELEEQNAVLQKALTADVDLVSVSRGGVNPVSCALDFKPVDWAEVARQLGNRGSGGYLQTNLATQSRLEGKLEAMDVGELATSLDEIAAAELSEADRNLLDRTLIGLLLRKDPERGLNRFIDRVHDEGSSPISWMLASELGQWAMTDAESAIAWFDEQIAEGKFESRMLGENQHVRIRFEHELIFALLSSAPDEAGPRLAAFPEDQRLNLLRGVGVGRQIRGDEEAQRAFAEMLREQLSEEDRLGAITWPMTDLGETGTNEYPELEAYFSRIDASSEERDACILAVAKNGRFERKSGNVFVTTPADLDTLRAWVGNEKPELRDQVTAGALKFTLNMHHSAFPIWAEYAVALHDTGGSDEILISVIEAHNADEHRELARELVRRLSDEERRNRYLRKFE